MARIPHGAVFIPSRRGHLPALGRSVDRRHTHTALRASQARQQGLRDRDGETQLLSVRAPPPPPPPLLCALSSRQQHEVAYLGSSVDELLLECVAIVAVRVCDLHHVARSETHAGVVVDKHLPAERQLEARLHGGRVVILARQRRRRTQRAS